jgi:DNA-binding transcriptional LysR family regulator
MDVELRHLRAFIAVATHLSFTRSAEQLFVTQPALTRTIKQLEGLLEVRLLERDTRHVRLTTAGERFLDEARSAVAAVDRAVASVGSRPPLRLGFSWLLPSPWAQTAVTEYERGSAGEVAMVRTDDPVGALLRGDIDVAVIRDHRAVGSAVRVVRLFTERRILICSTGSTIGLHEPVRWSDLRQWPFVFNSASGTVGPWTWPEDDGPARFVETNNYDEWLESIAADRGVSVVPELAAQRTAHPSIRFVPLIDGPPTTASLAFVLGHQDAAKQRFVEAALRAVRDERVVTEPGL